LAEYLIDAGKLKSAELERTQELANEDGQSLGLLLTRVGLVSDRDLAHAYAELLNRPLLTDAEIPVAALADIACKESFLRESKILPLANDANLIRVATADPENTFALDALTLAAGKPLGLSIATVSQIERGLDLCFGGAPADADGVGTDSADTSADASESIERLRDLASEAPIIRLVNLIIQRAVEARASDIHVEPRDDGLRIRYRIDGVLQEVQNTPTARSAAAIVSRLKLMAKMNIAERRLPQDGRIHIRMQGEVIDLRVSTVPTVEGESVVLRILAQDRIALDLESLGFDEGAQQTLEAMIDLPHGIILVTGPTGSGKTTTLYALLRRLNSKESKILTIEDPVEYQLEGINQIQVKPQIGLDFPQALRSIVRQDPDIIMIGEMRDLETARIAVQSALTGHLVLSTLHTNDAPSTINRLLNMGIEPFMVASSVVLILAQRLARRICLQCKEEVKVSAETLVTAGFSPSEAGTVKCFHGKGCQTCGTTGYKGRVALYEVMPVGEELRELILQGGSADEIKRKAIELGMRTLRMSGLQKVREGLTTVEEVVGTTFAD
jgi:general secretion pathway protein E